MIAELVEVYCLRNRKKIKYFDIKLHDRNRPACLLSSQFSASNTNT